MMKKLIYLFLSLCSLLPLRAQYTLRLDSLGLSLDFPCSKEEITEEEEVYDSGISMRVFIGKCAGKDVFGFMCLTVPDSLSRLLGASMSREILLAIGKGIVEENGRQIYKHKTRNVGERQIVDMRYTDPAARGRIRIIYTSKPATMMLMLIYSAVDKENKKLWMQYSKSLKISL